jgi:hypothetical protein
LRSRASYFDSNAFQRFATSVVGDASTTSAAQLRVLFGEFQSRMAGEERLLKR